MVSAFATLRRLGGAGDPPAGEPEEAPAEAGAGAPAGVPLPVEPFPDTSATS
jgi:hypothetical protein